MLILYQTNQPLFTLLLAMEGTRKVLLQGNLADTLNKIFLVKNMKMIFHFFLFSREHYPLTVYMTADLEIPSLSTLLFAKLVMAILH